MDLDSGPHQLDVEPVDDLSESRFEEIIRECTDLKQEISQSLDRKDYVNIAKYGTAAYIGSVAASKVYRNLR